MSKAVSRTGMYLLLIIGGFASLFPFYWMFVMATHSNTEIFHWPPLFWFGTSFLNNYHVMMQKIPFWLNLYNSIFVAVMHTALVLLFCTMAGYAFAMYRFPGRNALFAAMLVTMMIPWTTYIIPWFILMKWFGWIGSMKALIIPGIANAFGIFWMRQYTAANVPQELLQAARIDGCPEWQILFRVVRPILAPAMSALGIMTFMQSWNAFLIPNLILRDPQGYTLPVALNALRGDPTRGFDYGVLMTATALAVVPMVVAFLLMARKFMAGLTAGALKG